MLPSLFINILYFKGDLEIFYAKTDTIIINRFMLTYRM